MSSYIKENNDQELVLPLSKPQPNIRIKLNANESKVVKTQKTYQGSKK